MMVDDRHVVINKAGKMACKGWRGAPGSGFIWSDTIDLDVVLTFPTRHGAQLFANMNGGAPVPLNLNACGNI